MSSRNEITAQHILDQHLPLLLAVDMFFSAAHTDVQFPQPLS